MGTNKLTKILGTIIGVLLFIILMAGVTYAWVTWHSSNINLSGKTECFNIDYTNTESINNANILLFDEKEIIKNNKITIKNGMAVFDITANINSNCSLKGELTISLNITDINSAFITGESKGAFKYTLVSYDPENYTDLSITSLEGNAFDIINKNSINSTEEIILATEELSLAKKGYMVLLYIDGDLASNDAKNSTFSGSIKGVANQTE